MAQISVVIPCHNAEATLRGAIDSALAQAGIDLEIVVVDDGSTDRSLELARGYEPAVKTLTGHHLGVSVARNRGIAASSGEWLVFLDADDALLPGTLRARVDAASSDTDVVICDWVEIVEPTSTAGGGHTRSVNVQTLAGDPEMACASSVWAPPAALMYRREIVERIGGFQEDLRLIQDARFLFDAARAGARFRRTAHRGAVYRVHASSNSHRDPEAFWNHVLKNGIQIGGLWRGDRRLDSGRREALAQTFNAAAHGLFLAGAPSFHEALAALRDFGLTLTWRNRAARFLMSMFGQRNAMRLAALWRVSRLAALPRMLQQNARPSA